MTEISEHLTSLVERAVADALVFHSGECLELEDHKSSAQARSYEEQLSSQDRKATSDLERSAKFSKLGKRTLRELECWTSQFGAPKPIGVVFTEQGLVEYHFDQFEMVQQQDSSWYKYFKVHSVYYPQRVMLVKGGYVQYELSSKVLDPSGQYRWTKQSNVVLPMHALFSARAETWQC